MSRMAVFIAIAFIALADASVECRAEKIAPPPGSGNGGGSSNCTAQCSSYPNPSKEYSAWHNTHIVWVSLCVLQEEVDHFCPTILAQSTVQFDPGFPVRERSVAAISSVGDMQFGIALPGVEIKGVCRQAAQGSA